MKITIALAILLIIIGAAAGWLITLANAERALKLKTWCKGTWAKWRAKK